MGIVEKAHVEDQIGIARDAAAIGKRGHKDAQPRLLERKMAGQQTLQIGGGQEGGVDHQVSTFAQGGERLALEPDSVHDRAVAGEGVGASCLCIAPFEPLVITVDKQHPELSHPPADDGVEGFEHALDGEAAGAGIGADRDCRRIRRDIIDQRRDERERQVVEGLIAHILEDLERSRPPATRHPGHEEHAGAARPACQARNISTPAGHHRRSRAAGDASRRPVMSPPAGGCRSARRRRRRPRPCGSRPRSWPRCASTICFEIDRPRPEWVPNFSPAGRSL